MKITVLDALTVGEDIDLTPLQAFGEVTVYENTAPEALAARLKDTDIAVSNKIKYPEALLRQCGALRLICLAATGYDTVDLDCCRERGIGVCNVKGYSTESVAQLTVTVALALWSRLFAYTDWTRSGAYTKSGIANKLTPPVHELSGRTWGVIGLGQIGTRVAEVAKALGCRVIAYSRTAKEGFERADLDTLLKEADIVSVHLPLNEQTRGLISAEKLARMKPSAVFVNMARGAVTEEEALARAIEQGRLGALGADVFSTEPFPEEHPFFRIRERENVCLTPHMAWGAAEARQRCIGEIAENIRVWLQGGSRNRVDRI